MKPVSVSFRCFGPYIKKQTIPFDQLAEYGLFLICGETGSGKTTILDAMSCALYGSCSGDIRGELEAMRCKQANPDDPTEVEFVFEHEGKTYLFRRKLTPRKKRKAETEESYNEENSCCVDMDGNWIPLLDNCKKKSMNAKAAELIGLDLNQFRQVIILPQGKFETLLTSRSEDKESILSSLFHTERWKTAVDRMVEDLKGRNDEILRENQTIQDGLKKLGTASAAELPEAVEQAGKDADQAVRAEEEAKKRRALAQERLELSRAYQELDRRQESLEAAGKAAEEDHGIQVRLDMAVRAEGARKPHDEWKQAQEELRRAEARLKEAEENRALAEADLKQAEEEKNRHAETEPEQQQRENEFHRLSEMRNRYLEIEKLQGSLNTAKRAMEDAGRELAAAGNAADGEKQRLQRLETAWNDALDQYNLVSRAYQAGAAGHFAAALKAGEPCPVCGSVHHPSPAVLPDDAPTAVDVENAEKKTGAARKSYEKQKSAHENAENARREKEKAYQDAKAEYDRAEGALKNGLALRDPNLGTLRELDQRCAELQKAIRQYSDRKEALAEKCSRLSGNFRAWETSVNDRRTQLDESGKNLREKEEIWKKTLTETGLGTEAQYNAMILPPEKQHQMRKTLSDHAAALENAKKAVDEQREKLAGKDRPETGDAEAAYQEADETYRVSISARALAVDRRDQLARDARKLAELDAALAEKRRKYEEDSAFVRALRGSTGMSLQRYVLSVRLGQVIAEANRLLSGIYGGRYRLHRSNESYGSSHKSGLELEVYDSMSDQHRSVCTLSGGEKFLAALSLAIGLCTVVQNEQKGVSLEAMFIDEGFGSLDQNSLGDALDILQGVQRGRGMVGIISHVQLLEETIPTKVLTKKTAYGSDTSMQFG